ncbi:unnamed protein product [Ectocarpus sp. 13 AM-2016]
MRSDPRLVKMWWDGGLVMISAIVEDAAGVTGLPGITFTHGPWKLTIEALKTNIDITAPADANDQDGFVAVCGGDVGLNRIMKLGHHLRGWTTISFRMLGVARRVFGGSTTSNRSALSCARWTTSSRGATSSSILPWGLSGRNSATTRPR